MKINSYASIEDFSQKISKFSRSYISEYASIIDRDDVIPTSVILELAGHRLYAIDSLSDDGPKLSCSVRTRLILKIIEELGRVSPVIAKHVMDQNFGPVALLRRYGNTKLVEKYLPLIKRGEKQAAFLMTEPQSGSDLRLFKTTAHQAGDRIILNGTKDWITGATMRQLYFLVASSEFSSNEMGLFLVDRDEIDNVDEYIGISDRKEKLGLRGLGEHRVSIKNVSIPRQNIILSSNKTSLKKIMTQYNYKRCA